MQKAASALTQKRFAREES